MPSALRNIGATRGIGIISEAGAVKLFSGGHTTSDLVLEASDTGIQFSGAYRFPTTDGSTGQVLQTNGSGTLSFASVLDSNTVTGVIDQAYVRANQITYSTADFTDSAWVSNEITTAVNNLVDGAPAAMDTLAELAAALNNDSNAFNTLLGYITDLPDSAQVQQIIDQAYIRARQITYNTSDFADSAYVQSYFSANVPRLGTDYVDSAYVTGLPVSTFTNDANYLDSTTVQGVIDQSYVRSNQDYSYTSLTDLPDFFDSADATTLVDAAYVQARQITYSTADFTDSAWVSNEITTAINNLIDGAPGALDTLNELAAALNDDANAFDTLLAAIDDLPDSAQVIGLIDSAHVRARQDYSYTSLVDLPDFFDSADATILIDSAYIQARQRLVDSSSVSNIIVADVDSAYVQARQDYAYSSLTGTPTALSEFTNDTNYLDSNTVTGVIDQAYIQGLQTTYNTSDFTDSAWVSNEITTAINNLIDGAPGALDTLNELAAAMNDDADAFNTLLGYITDLPDSAQVQQIIDSAYVQARQTLRDSSWVRGVRYSNSSINEILHVDKIHTTDQFLVKGGIGGSEILIGAHVDSGVTLYNGSQARLITQSDGVRIFGNLTVDSANVTKLYINGETVDSGWVTSRLTDSAIQQLQTHYLDSAEIIDLIDADYINSLGVVGTDSAAVETIVQIVVDSDYIRARSNVSAKQELAGGGETDVDLTLRLVGLGNGTIGLQAEAPVIDSIGNTTQTILTYRGIDSASVGYYIDSAYIQARQAGGATNTDGLAEGSTNLYYTDERVDDRIASLLLTDSAIAATYNDSAGTLTISAEKATTTTVGVASFDASNFNVTAQGHTTIIEIDGGTY
jgi:hypothetical protein